MATHQGHTTEQNGLGGYMLDRRIHRITQSLTLVARDETGQGLVEYALMIMLVALAAIIAVTALGVSLQDTIDFVNAQFP